MIGILFVFSPPLNIIFESKLIKNEFIIDFAYWIDVCQSNGNLLASGGGDGITKIFDKRESKIVKTFEDVHPSK